MAQRFFSLLFQRELHTKRTIGGLPKFPVFRMQDVWLPVELYSYKTKLFGWPLCVCF